MMNILVVADREGVLYSRRVNAVARLTYRRPAVESRTEFAVLANRFG